MVYKVNKGSVKGHKTPRGKGGSIMGGQRAHEHAFAGDSVHDRHIKTVAHSGTHMMDAVKHLAKQGCK